VGAHDVTGLVAIEILIIIVVQHAALHRAGFGRGIDPGTVVAIDADGIVGRAGALGMRGIGGDEVAVLVQHRVAGTVHLIPDIGIIGDAADVVRLHVGEDHLDAGLILPFLQALIVGIVEVAVY